MPFPDPNDPGNAGDIGAAELAAAIAAAGPRDIAVTGMSGSFPRARDLARFWANLRDGVEGVTFLSDDELRAAGVPAADLAQPNYVKAASLLDGSEEFDAAFFGYSARDAEVLDPQQRLFLEHSWAALENAGHSPGAYRGLIGVYAGVAWNTYLLTQLATRPELFARGGGFQVFIANDKDFMPTRVSYKLNLKGPSLIVQTSCSTSLVAIHLACLSLLNYECDMALAGGVTVRVPQTEGYFYEDGGLASPDGRCRSFDAAAAGTIFGSGVGVVVLKRLADALADGDRVRAVVKGSAINNDGSVKVSYTAPSVEGQAEVIAAAQAVAGVEPATIQYVEAHGTGTALGDPIEVAALAKVFAAAAAPAALAKPAAPAASENGGGTCLLGSVKSNVGHLDAAAGVAGFIKTVLALEHRQIPPSLHYERPNPKIDFASGPFRVAARLADWPATDGPRRAGVSSFGVGGTNAHVILEEAPPLPASGASRPQQLLLLSARTPAALAAAGERLADHLEAQPGLPLADAAFTLAVGRTVFRHRRALVAADGAEAAALLRSGDPARVATAVDSQEPRERPVVFLFPGQGTQFPDMGLDLYRQEPVFRDEVDRCAELLVPHLGSDLRQALYPAAVAASAAAADNGEEAARRLGRTALAQPALFTVEYALARLWMSWGVRPVACLGHSIGEWVAACLAGVFTLPDALALVAARGQLMQDQAAGGMSAVPLAAEEVLPLLGPRLELAAINEPQRVVVSGPFDALEELERRLAERGIEARRLHTSHAFHSAMMDPVLPAFAARLRTVERGAPQIPLLSNVSGTWIGAGEAEDPGYWTRQLRSPVRFAAALAELAGDPERVLLEVGPGRSLATLARRQAEGLTVLTSMRHPGDPEGDLAPLLSALGRLWLAGAQVDWPGFFAGQRRARVELPPYPFERQRYWITARHRGEPREPERPAEAAAAGVAAGAGEGGVRKQPDVADWFYLPGWRTAPPLPPWRPGILAADRRRRWLVLADDCGLGAAVAEALRAEGREVVTVTTSAEGYDEVLAELAGGGAGLPDAIVHAWSLDAALPGGGATQERNRFDAAQELGFASLVALARALSARGVDSPLELWVLTSGVQRVTGREALAPERATVLGPCRVISQELPAVACQAIDVVLPESGQADAAGQALAGLVLAEIAAGPSGRLLAHRDGRRWEEVFTPWRLSGESAPLCAPRRHGVYLVTGGLEGVGFGLARHLAATVGARLLLIVGPAQEPQTARVRSLEEAGAEVLVAAVPAWEAGALAAAVAQAEARWGGLDGAIHAAAVAGERTFLPLAGTGAAEAAWHFAPRAHGLLALDRALAGRRLDFRLAVSSLAAVLGGVGYAAYAAANQFVDAFAQAGAGRGEERWLAVQWDAWSEDGASLAESAASAAPLGKSAASAAPPGDRAAPAAPLRESAASAFGAGLAELAMSPAEGGEVFRRVLAGAAGEQVTVSTAGLAERIAAARRRAEARGRAGTAAGEPAERHARPALATPFVAPGTPLEQTIAEVWRRTLGFAEVGIDDNFFEIGGDSFVAVRMASDLKQALAMEIPVAKLYQGLTVRALAQLLAPAAEDESRQLAHHLAERRETMDRRQEFLRNRRAGRRTS